jgi:hypothetical protein
MGCKKHYRVRHNRDEFVRGGSHINDIEGFWDFAKTRQSHQVYIKPAITVSGQEVNHFPRLVLSVRRS